LSPSALKVLWEAEKEEVVTVKITERDPEVQQLLDKQAVREVLVRYCRGVDRCDAALISSTYHPDAVDQHSGRNFTGETVGEGIAEWVRSSSTCSMHHVTNQMIELDGDLAASETYYAVWQREIHDGEPRTLQAIGRYLDRLERRDGEWKIAHRLVITELVRYLPPQDFPMPLNSDFGRRDHTDPSYELLGA
jgi:ketosteroid isomerase-like protein